MRTMYDGITPEHLPIGGDIYASYVDTYGNGFYRLAALFPNALHVSISVHGNSADVLDVENGAAGTESAPGWATYMRSLGRVPTVYTFLANWSAVRREFDRQEVEYPQWWIATWDGNPTLLDYTVAHQYLNRPGFDASAVSDYWPGIELKPIGDDMSAQDVTAINTYTGQEAGIIVGEVRKAREDITVLLTKLLNTTDLASAIAAHLPPSQALTITDIETAVVNALHTITVPAT